MNSSKEALKRLIEQGLEVGSKVIVLKRTDPSDYMDSWVDLMDEWIGEEVVVDEIRRDGNKLGLRWCDDVYYFPATSVELVKEEDEDEVHYKFEVDVNFIKQAHAAACSDWKKKIEKQFPKAFKPVYFNFGEEHMFSTSFDFERSPLVIGHGCAPTGLRDQTLIVNDNYELEVREHGGYTQLLFKRK